MSLKYSAMRNTTIMISSDTRAIITTSRNISGAPSTLICRARTPLKTPENRRCGARSGYHYPDTVEM
jgi:hypothetical protein